MKSKLRSLPAFLVALGAYAACAWLVGVAVENLRAGSWPRAAGTVESGRDLENVGTLMQPTPPPPLAPSRNP